MREITVLRAGQGPIRRVKGQEGLTTGMLVQFLKNREVRPHQHAGGNAAPFFVEALPERQVEGEKRIDWNRIPIIMALPGDYLEVLLASGEEVSAGDYLESDGNGYLRKHVAPTEPPFYLRAILAVAERACTAPKDEPAPARIIAL